VQGRLGSGFGLVVRAARAVAVIAVVIALAVGIGLLRAGRDPSATTGPSPSSGHVAVVAGSPSGEAGTTSPEPSVQPIASESSAETVPPSAEPPSTPGPMPTHEAIPGLTPTPRPVVSTGSEDPPTKYSASGSFGQWVKNRDLSIKIEVVASDPERPGGCAQHGFDGTASVELTMNWPGHTRTRNFAIQIGPREGPSIQYENSDGYLYTGIPLLVSECHDSSDPMSASVWIDADAPNTFYYWHVH
jgi:hypothetical protein